MNKNWKPTWLEGVDVESIQKEVNEAVTKILNKHGFDYNPREIVLHNLMKMDDPTYAALGVIHYPMIEQWCDEIRARLEKMSTLKSEIWGYLCSIEKHATVEPKNDKQNTSTK